jgi:hypothetical protein
MEEERSGTKEKESPEYPRPKSPPPGNSARLILQPPHRFQIRTSLQGDAIFILMDAMACGNRKKRLKSVCA